MKLKFFSKLLLWLGCLLCLAIGAALITAAVCDGVVFHVESVFGCVPADAKWVDLCVLAAGVVLVLFALYALSVPGKLRYRRRSFVVQTTESGDLRIAIKAIEGLVKRCVDMHEEISLSSMRILSGKTGVVVELRISLHGNISIPLAVASLQKQIKQYLLASSGIEAKHVSVTVDTTKMDAVKKCAPYAVTEEADAESEAKKEKKPLHQRLFAQKNEPEKVKAEDAKPAEVKVEEKPEEKTEEEAAPAQPEVPAEPAEEMPAEEAAEATARETVEEEKQEDEAHE